MKYADIIIPRGLDNTAAIDVVSKHVFRQLNERGMMFLKNQLAEMGGQVDVNKPLPTNLKLLNPTTQIRSMHTIIRNKNTSRHDFIFYADRLSRLVIERGLDELPYRDTETITPLNLPYKGSELVEKMCGVSIVRAGATMEKALRTVINELPIGKILIQTDQRTGEPTLNYCKLPSDISQRYVILTDATLATGENDGGNESAREIETDDPYNGLLGAAALMAIRVLLEHLVPEDRIIFLCLIAAPPGIHTISNAFPKVRIVTSAVDAKLNELFHILPGIGNFGDRYFGT